jgi:hypothetical protein
MNYGGLKSPRVYKTEKISLSPAYPHLCNFKIPSMSFFIFFINSAFYLRFNVAWDLINCEELKIAMGNVYR